MRSGQHHLGERTAVVGIDMLPELLQGAQTDHGPAAKPERCHRPKLLVQTDQELMETSTSYYVLQVSISVEKEDQNTR